MPKILLGKFGLQPQFPIAWGVLLGFCYNIPKFLKLNMLKLGNAIAPVWRGQRGLQLGTGAAAGHCPEGWEQSGSAVQSGLFVLDQQCVFLDTTGMLLWTPPGWGVQMFTPTVWRKHTADPKTGRAAGFQEALFSYVMFLYAFFS